MKTLNAVLIFAFTSSCAQSPSITNLQLVKSNEISQYELMLKGSQDYESISCVRGMDLTEDNDKSFLTYFSYDPICSFYDTKKKQFTNSNKLNDWVKKYANETNRVPYNIGTYLYNDTLCVLSKDDLFVFNFKNFELLTQAKVAASDGLFFYKSNIYTNRTDKLLSIYTLDGRLVKRIEFPRETLSDYLFFSNDYMFVYNDYTNEVTSAHIDSLESFATKKRKIEIQKELHLMYISDKYFVCGYKSVNSSPFKSNELVFLNKLNPHEKVLVTLDDATINDSVLDKDILKKNVDGAPEPVFKPYWSICGSDDTYYFLIQSQKKLNLYTFRLKE